MAEDDPLIQSLQDTLRIVLGARSIHDLREWSRAQAPDDLEILLHDIEWPKGSDVYRRVVVQEFGHLKSRQRQEPEEPQGQPAGISGSGVVSDPPAEQGETYFLPGFGVVSEGGRAASLNERVVVLPGGQSRTVNLLQAEDLKDAIGETLAALGKLRAALDSPEAAQLEEPLRAAADTAQPGIGHNRPPAPLEDLRDVVRESAEAVEASELRTSRIRTAMVALGSFVKRIKDAAVDEATKRAGKFIVDLIVPAVRRMDDILDFLQSLFK